MHQGARGTLAHVQKLKPLPSLKLSLSHLPSPLHSSQTNPPALCLSPSISLFPLFFLFHFLLGTQTKWTQDPRIFPLCEATQDPLSPAKSPLRSHSMQSSSSSLDEVTKCSREPKVQELQTLQFSLPFSQDLSLFLTHSLPHYRAIRNPSKKNPTTSLNPSLFPQNPTGLVIADNTNPFSRQQQSATLPGSDQAPNSGNPWLAESWPRLVSYQADPVGQSSSSSSKAPEAATTTFPTAVNASITWARAGNWRDDEFVLMLWMMVYISGLWSWEIMQRRC